jgi:hypothetical protein
MKYICLIFILLPALAIAQISPGPRSLAMGSAGTALQDVWSLQHNPAGIAQIERSIIALAYQRHFSDQDLSTQKAVLVMPFKKNVLGLSFHRFGFKSFYFKKQQKTLSTEPAEVRLSSFNSKFTANN